MPCGVAGNAGVEDDVVDVMDVGGAGGGSCDRALMASLDRAAGEVGDVSQAVAGH